MSSLIREAQSSEYLKVAEIACIAWSVKPNIQFILDRLTQDNSKAWVAIIDNQIVGITTATLQNAQDVYSEETVVLPQWRREGIAQQLLDCMKEYYKKLGVRYIYGESTARHPKELTYFIKQGFKPYKMVKGPFGYEPEEVVYWTRLDLV